MATMTKTMKQHKLKTLQDVLDVATDKNVDVLVNDLAEWVRFHLILKNIAKQTKKLDVLVEASEYGIMMWNDDGIKGNCDAELVLQATIDFFEKKYEKATIITSDGDFACLVKFLLKNGSLDHILSPRLNKRCSSLLKSTKAKITFLPEVKDLIEFK